MNVFLESLYRNSPTFKRFTSNCLWSFRYLIMLVMQSCSFTSAFTNFNCFYVFYLYLVRTSISEPVFLVLVVFSLLTTIIDVFSRRLFIPSFPINYFSRLGTNYYWIHSLSMEIIINFSSCNYFSDDCVNQFLNIKNSCIPEINYYWLWLKNISMDCYALFVCDIVFRYIW